MENNTIVCGKDIMLISTKFKAIRVQLIGCVIICQLFKTSMIGNALTNSILVSGYSPEGVCLFCFHLWRITFIRLQSYDFYMKNDK